jgi:hypothetical protein
MLGLAPPARGAAPLPGGSDRAPGPAPCEGTAIHVQPQPSVAAVGAIVVSRAF